MAVERVIVAYVAVARVVVAPMDVARVIVARVIMARVAVLHVTEVLLVQSESNGSHRRLGLAVAGVLGLQWAVLEVSLASD